MLKALFFAVLAANILLLVSSTGSSYSSSSSAASSSSSSTFSSSSAASSSSRSTATEYEDEVEDYDYDYDSPPTCGLNEVFSECTLGVCRNQYCTQKGKPVACPGLTPGSCEKGCVCKENYLRAENGTCIPENQCPAPTGCGGDPNAQAIKGCGSGCRKSCSNYKQFNGLICPAVCRTGCDCKPGYVYDDALKKCVLPKDCTPKCGLNEVFSECTQGVCRNQYCTQKGMPVACPGLTPGSCEKGCVCQENYLRAENGTCIPENECPDQPCGGDPNAQPGCGQNCKRCSNYNTSADAIVCPLICKIGGCDCKPDYVFDDNIEKCVLPSQCTPTCGLNEVFSECTLGVCRNQYCTQKGKPVACPGLTPGSCEKGCVCKENYLRAENGTCIPENQCPAPTGCGGDPNAQAIKGCGSGCRKSCSNYKQFNGLICPAVCRTGCDCKPGYVYDDALKKCVLPKDCTPKCGLNEVFSECTQGVCRNQYCTQKGMPVACPGLTPGSCEKGCVCQENYLRAENGTCIPENECPDQPCGGDPNAQPGCGQNCKRCSNYNTSADAIVCPLICKIGGCDCKPDYVFDDNIEKCVLPSQCTPVCGNNEYFSNCSNGGCFGAINCSEKGRPIKCVKLIPSACKKGCLCKKGYLRNKKGDCVLEKQCEGSQKCTKPNEVYEDCPGTCPGRTCAVDDRLVFCPKQPTVGDSNCKPPACRCASGFYRNDNGDCVTWDECRNNQTCPTNEVYDLCPTKCPFRTCGIDDTLIDCIPSPRVGDSDCAPPACRCADGLYRNDKGVCVPWEDCPKCNNRNEKYDPCPALCPPQSCDVDERVIRCKAPPQLGDPECKAGCVCEDGFKRNKAGQCIPKDMCKKCTRPNEYYDPCPDTCPPQVCASIYSKYNCPLQKVNKTCVGSCRCEPGYYRNKIGDCISTEDCLKCTGPNEFFSCGGACDNVCSNLSKQSQTNCPIRNIVCNKMCYCESGYARNADGTCVPFAECEPEKCDINEEYSTCTQAVCRNQKCSEKGKSVACPLILEGYCIKGCVCKEGYLRAENGTCIPEDQCQPPKQEPICDANEEYSTCTQATCRTQECSEKGKPVACPIIAEGYCIKGCVCKEGYLRAENGTCIPENQCQPPKQPTCLGPNEEYSGCSNGGCYGPRNCADLGGPFICVDLIEGGCIGGCLCKEGYYRNDKDVCVPEEECRGDCGDFEIFSNCTRGLCRNELCSQQDDPTVCIALADYNCEKGCVCQKNYLRAANGTCIPADQCPTSKEPTCDVNEEYSTCTRVTCSDQKCSEKEKPVANPGIAEEYCIEGCVCKKGYLRAENGTCIPGNQSQPPKQEPICDANEEYSTCTQATCRTQECSEKGKPVACPRIAEGYCIKGCVCKEGYLRAENGTCIPENQCQPPKQPTCSGPNEQYSGCSNGGCYGPRKCADLGGPFICVDLIAGGCRGGCICKKGFYRNDKDVCVSEKECRGDCGSFEIFSNCTGGLCRNELCSQQDNPTMCIALADNNCEKGCVCQKNYLRAANGTCIPADQCPPSQEKCGINEYYDECPPSCSPQLCSQKRKVPCPPSTTVCKPACRCQKGFLRNNEGTCVPKNECSTRNPCPEGEQYNTCPAAKCDAEYCPKDRNSPQSCISTRNCGEPRCTCGFNQKRNRKTGKCVAIADCPPFKCNGPNEKYQACPPVCPGEKCSDYINNSTCPKFGRIGIVVPCIPQCRCKKNYYRNSKGICVTGKQCKKEAPAGCGGDPNAQAIKGCGRGCRKSCSNYKQFNDLICPDVCRTGCDCKPGYVYDDALKKCVLPKDCNNAGCGGDINAVEIKGCGSGCRKSCSNYKQFDELICPAYCRTGCDCKPGYVYDDDFKKCVLPKDCTQSTTEPTTEPSDTNPGNNEDAQKRFSDAINNFTIKFFKEVMNSQENKSTIMSPYSVTTPLAQLQLRTNGSSYEQLSSVLNLLKDEVPQVFRALLDSYKNVQDVIISFANKFYANIEFPLKEDFIEEMKTIFDADPENIDCSDSTKAAALINEYIERVTNNRIKDLVTPDMITPLTRLILVNAIYFKGLWKTQFNRNNTQDRDFYVTKDLTVKVPTMYLKSKLRTTTSQDLDAQVLEMLFRNGNYSCVFILPNKKYEGLSVLASKLTTESLNKAMNSMRVQDVKVYMPRYKIETSIDLAEVLPQLGVKDIFNPKKSGIYNILKTHENVFVSAAKQKAFVEVNEEGSEATAANAVVISTRSLPRPPAEEIKFVADHPFAFIIRHKETILFIGAFCK